MQRRFIRGAAAAVGDAVRRDLQFPEPFRVGGINLGPLHCSLCARALERVPPCYLGLLEVGLRPGCFEPGLAGLAGGLQRRRLQRFLFGALRAWLRGRRRRGRFGVPGVGVRSTQLNHALGALGVLLARLRERLLELRRAGRKLLRRRPQPGQLAERTLDLSDLVLDVARGLLRS